MPDVYRTIENLGIQLPSTSVPAASYVSYTQSGSLVFVSGHLARKDGKIVVGQLGRSMNTTEGEAAARAIAFDLIGTLHLAVRDLNRITRIVKVVSYVNSAPDFTEQHLVTNGCSDALADVFGDAGKHARSAFGVAQLPLGACLEIDLIAELAP